jgi:predicted nucleotidyltransferase
MSHLTHVASVLSTTDRTLRRAARDGLIRTERESERKQRIPYAEQRYLLTHWPLLRDLRAALRTEPSVRMAVLFGSTARGDDHETSDVDVAVELRTGDTVVLHELEQRLRRATARRIDLVTLSNAREHPMLWSEILLHGRALVDRTSTWPSLRADAVEVADRADRELQRRARLALERTGTQ